MTLIEQIKAKIDIVDLVGEAVKLRRSGRSYSGLCPFHSEKTPSFHVFPETQTWRCFGACATGGDIFNFIMRRENVDFAEALKTLAQRAGVPLAARSPGALEEDARIKKMRELNEAAVRYYHNLLIAHETARSVRAYLAGREISEASQVNFQLGFAPDSWDALSRYLTQRGYLPKDIYDAGLTSERDGGGFYDRFRNRLMFPIRDIKGQTIGFGARALDELQQPKYLNSPQTPLFDKSAVLYAADMAKEAIRAQGTAVIVEGYVDVVMAHQKGFKNVVASMGTALTESQLKTLQRWAKKFILALDADAAGLEAMRRGLSVAHAALDKESVPLPVDRTLTRYESRSQAEIRVAQLPAGFDPDDLLRQDPAAWQAMLDSALPMLDYVMQAVIAPLDLSSARGKSEAARALVPLIKEMADPLERGHYLDVLARRLRVAEDDLLAMASAIKPQAAQSRKEAKAQPPAERAQKMLLEPEDGCLALLLYNPAQLANLERLGLRAEDFAATENRQIFELLKQQAEAGLAEPAFALREMLDPVLLDQFDQLMAWAQTYGSPPPVEIEKAVLRLRGRVVHAQVMQMRQRADEAQQTGEAEQAEDYKQMMNMAIQQLDWIQKESYDRSAAGRAQRESSASGLTAHEKTA
ncbi:MAG: DNA primase [Chloroflexi bacterium]|nr:DNA primase [Chloroflexota bacterium]